jgi:two-component system cell cycle sensor histidine kinase/response regulator CckA
MYQFMKKFFGWMNNGCRIPAVMLTVLLGCIRASASDREAVWPAPGASRNFALLPPIYGWAAIIALGAIVVALPALAAVRWARRWRQRTLHQMDAEVHRLADEWTKRLQQEVSERKQAQQSLLESQELILRQERLSAVGQLSGGVAHEFNNIMTIVQGHASLLMDNPDLDEESIKSLAHINDGVERMAKLIRQMLAFSRKQVMQQKALDVRETLGHTSDTLGRMLGDQVLLRFEIAPQLPPILADPDMFQQIVVNLVVNARDAMSSGGQLTIRASEASFAAANIPAKSNRREGRFVCLSVTDTGSGMDTAIIHRLFEPFFTTKEVGKGVGLGLATVHGMVNQNHGWIEVESKVGRGTTFDIYFPATDLTPENPAGPAEPPEVRGGHETVLVVDDEWVLRELVREILGSHGYQVLEAADGLEALRVWEENRDKVDLLLTDMAMPHGLSGRELADRLRQDDPGLPVLFSSGFNQELIERSEDAGQGFFYLSKPYNPSQLAQAVRGALDAAWKRETRVAARAS